MLDLDLYQAPNMNLWQSRREARGTQYFAEIINPLDLSAPVPCLPGSIALLGFASDIGVKRNLGRIGAALGPYVIKSALARLPIHKEFTLYDAGTIITKDDDLESTQETLSSAVDLLLKQQIFPIILGGGHETAWGHYQGLVKVLEDRPLHIVNLDAHFDLRPLVGGKGNSGTAFWQIAAARKALNLPFHYHCLGIQTLANNQQSFETAKQTGTRYLLAESIHQAPKTVESFLKPILEDDKAIYLSICLDVFADSMAPGVSAPQILGLFPWQLIGGLRKLASSGKLLSIDLVEMAPSLDEGMKTSRLAASLIAECLTALTLAKEHT